MKYIVAAILLIVSPAALPVAPLPGQHAQTVQSSERSTTPTKNIKTITFCRDKQSLTPDSAFNDFSPISVEFLREIGKPYTGTVSEAKQYQVTLLEPPKHGEVKPKGYNVWTYLPTADYTGADSVTFLVNGQGKQYEVVINFWVLAAIDENSTIQECNSKKFGH